MTDLIRKIYKNALSGLRLIWDRNRDSVDWSKVKVDTKIQVRDFADEDWTNCYFAKYENGRVYAFNLGQTSFTTLGDDPASWEYARIYRENKEDAINE